MTKLYKEPVQVQEDYEGMPLSFHWRKCRYRINHCSIIKFRAYRLKWWVQPGPPRYRCETEEGLAYDLIRDKSGWVLERVWD